MSIRKEDVLDVDFRDAVELASDGYFVYLTTSLISTTSGTKTIVINLPSDGEGILHSFDHPAQIADRVRLTGTSGADGYYIINSIIDDTSFVVNETIANSTGGTIQFMHPAGAFNIGFDPTRTTHITHHNVQQALEDLDYSISGSGTGITPVEHERLRQLVHLANGVGGPFEGFASGAYREVTGGMLAPTKVIWYSDITKTSKIVEKTITYTNFFLPLTIQWQSYGTDGTTILAVVTDTITYNQVFESSRLRTIVDYTGIGGGAYLDPNTHKILRQLIHLADGVGGPFEGFTSGAYRETTYPINNPFKTSVIWYTDVTKTKKIVENSIFRNGINMPVTITWKAYDVDGITVLSTVTDSITYTNNIFETNRIRSIT